MSTTIELLRQAYAIGTEDVEEARKKDVSDAAILRESWELVNGTYKPLTSKVTGLPMPGVGDLVKKRHGLSVQQPSPVLILWRMLDDANFQDRIIIERYLRENESNIAERVDVIVGLMSRNQDQTIFALHATSLLETWRPCPYLQKSSLIAFQQLVFD